LCDVFEEKCRPLSFYESNLGGTIIVINDISKALSKKKPNGKRILYDYHVIEPII